MIQVYEKYRKTLNIILKKNCVENALYSKSLRSLFEVRKNT